MQYAATDEEHRYCLAPSHHPQHLERRLPARLGEVGGRGDKGGMSVAMFSFFELIEWPFL